MNDSPAPSITLDDSFWPLLTVQIRGAVPLASFEDYLAQRLTYLQRPEKHVTLFDMRNAPMLSSDVRQLQAEWLKQHGALLDAQMLGHALVITSPLLRLMMSTFLKVRPRSHTPYVVTPNLSDAARWGLKVLEEAGSTPPAERIKAHFGLTPH
ncbi:hypothetical protein [Archangium gephyra]|uniref:hypothetical protein n=1 Tax=Archangium gephyra TaxID=48 RepID=UPI0011C1CBC8|nr:hypothetical protein [Archangium gephyra]